MLKAVQFVTLILLLALSACTSGFQPGPVSMDQSGLPAVSYCRLDTDDLWYVSAADAADAAGSGWNLPRSVDSRGNVGKGNFLLDIGGLPAISYDDDVNLDLLYVLIAEP